MNYIQKIIYLVVVLMAQNWNLFSGHACSAAEKYLSKQDVSMQQQEKIKELLESVKKSVTPDLPKNILPFGEKVTALLSAIYKNSLTVIRENGSGKFLGNQSENNQPFQKTPKDLSVRKPFDSSTNNFIQAPSIAQNRRQAAKRFAKIRAEYAKIERESARAYAAGKHRLA